MAVGQPWQRCLGSAGGGNIGVYIGNILDRGYVGIMEQKMGSTI